MASINTTPETATSALGSVANFLASLNGGGGGHGANAALFANLLSEARTQTHTAEASKTAAAPPVRNNTNDGSSNALPSLKNLVAAWHHVMDKLQAQSTKDTPPATKASTTPTSTDDSSQSAQASSSTSKTATSSPTPAGNTDTDEDNTPAQLSAGGTAATVSPKPTSWRDALLGDEPASVGGNGGTTGTASDTPNTDDPKALDDILAELQILAMLIEKKLQASQPVQNVASGSDAQISATQNTPAATGTAPTDPMQGQLQAQAPASTPILPAVDPALSLPQDPSAMASLLPPSPSAPANPAVSSKSASNDAEAADASRPTDPTAYQTEAQISTNPSPTLDNVLAIIQQITKELDATQTVGTPSRADNPALPTAGATFAAMPSASQLRADLKSFLSALQDNKGVNANPTTTSLNDVSTPTSNTTTGLPTDSSIQVPTPPVDVAKSAFVAHDDIFNLFKATPNRNLSGQGLPNGGFALLSDKNSVADTAGKDGASLGSGSDQQNNNAATTGRPLLATDNSALSTNTANASVTNPYSFASQLSATRATNGGTTGLPSAVEQVVFQLNRSVKDGNDQMTLQLNPGDLGKVSIKLDFSTDGKVQGTVVADNPATLDLLLKDVRGLERALQDAGLRADPGSLQFSLGGQGQSSGQMPNPFSSPSSSSNDKVVPDMTADLSTLSTDTTETYYLTPGRVNMRV